LTLNSDLKNLHFSSIVAAASGTAACARTPGLTIIVINYSPKNG